MNREAKSITVAAIQHRSEPGEYEKNLKRAEELIRQAAEEDADLAVLPELFAAGYCPNEEIFSQGETEQGRTMTWLKEQAGRYRLFIGGGIPLWEEGHLYNRFYLCNPEGRIGGYAQKQFGESYCFRRGHGVYSIRTALGTLGIPICADAHLTSVIRSLRHLDIDLILMPHAWPTLREGGLKEKDFVRTVARNLNIPVVFVNGVGGMGEMQGWMGKLMARKPFQLRGQSCIVDGAGALLGSLQDQPGLLVRSISPGKVPGHRGRVPDYQGWIHPGSALIRKLVIPLDIRKGGQSYEKNRKKYRPGGES